MSKTTQEVANNGADQLVQSPEGFELKGNLSFSRLNPLAGELARDTKEPQLCGWITGIAYAHSTEEGSFGPFTRIIGEFFALPFNRSTEITATEMFLPGTAERFVKAAIDKAGSCPIRFEGWCFPDNSGRKGGTGYVYKVFVRQPPGVLSAARRMAIECGIIDAPLPPPAQAIEDRSGDPRGAMVDPLYDPETGEVEELSRGFADILKGKGRPEGIAAE